MSTYEPLKSAYWWRQHTKHFRFATKKANSVPSFLFRPSFYKQPRRTISHTYCENMTKPGESLVTKVVHGFANFFPNAYEHDHPNDKSSIRRTVNASGAMSETSYSQDFTMPSSKSLQVETQHKEHEQKLEGTVQYLVKFRWYNYEKSSHVKQKFN